METLLLKIVSIVYKYIIFAIMEEKKAEIIERTTMVYMRNGIKSVTMDDLARELGISKKTIYKHFEDKDHLVCSIIENKIKMEKEMCNNCTTASENALEEMLAVSKSVVENIGNINPSVFYDLQKYHIDAWKIIDEHKWNFVLQMMIENIKRGIDENIYRSDLNFEIIGRQYVVATDMIMNHEIYPWPTFKIDELFEEVMRFQLNGMVNENGRKILNKAL